MHLQYEESVTIASTEYYRPSWLLANSNLFMRTDLTEGTTIKEAGVLSILLSSLTATVQHPKHI